MDAMMTKLHASLAATLAAVPANIADTNVRAPNTPKSKAGKVVTKKLRDMDVAEYDVATDKALAMYFPDDAKRKAIDEFLWVAEDLAYATESKRALMADLASIAFPAGKVSYNQWQVLAAYLKGRSEYGYKSMVRAVKALPGMDGKLPSKDGKGKSGQRSASPKVWHNAFVTSLNAVRARIAACPKADIDPKALRAVIEALRALDAADRALGKSIAA